MPATRGSRYEYVAVYQDPQGRLYTDVPTPMDKTVLLRDASRYIAKAGDTPWSIAWKFYKATLDREQDFRPTSFFDVICQANDILDPFARIVEGKIILVPRLEVIQGEIRVPPPFFSRNVVT